MQQLVMHGSRNSPSYYGGRSLEPYPRAVVVTPQTTMVDFRDNISVQAAINRAETTCAALQTGSAPACLVARQVAKDAVDANRCYRQWSPSCYQTLENQKKRYGLDMSRPCVRGWYQGHPELEQALCADMM